MVSDQPASSSSSLRILVVDDNYDAAATLGMMLRLMGNAVRMAHDGEEAVSAAEEFRPDLLLLDLGLPKLNGYEVCRRIRQQAWGTEMLIVAVTGWGRDEDLQRTKEAGFDQHFVKPVRPVTLKKLLGEARGKLST
jgi:CheY-like chemotaxis protein